VPIEKPPDAADPHPHLAGREPAANLFQRQIRRLGGERQQIRRLAIER
jgi:hypothetical protein